MNYMKNILNIKKKKMKKIFFVMEARLIKILAWKKIIFQMVILLFCLKKNN